MMPEFCGFCSLKSKLIEYYKEHYKYLSSLLHRLRSRLGVPLTMLIFVFVAWQVYTRLKLVWPLVGNIRLDLFFSGFGVLVLAVVSLGYGWIWILRLLGMSVPWREGVTAYFLANLARYMPGGIWHFAGRLVWLGEQGYDTGVGAWSLLLEQGITLATAFIIGLVFSGWFDLTWVYIILFIAAVSVLFAAMLFLRQSVHEGESIWRYEKICLYWGVTIFGYVCFWILYGCASVLFAASVMGWRYTDVVSMSRLIGQTSLSWAVGYIVFLVPAGWGVREFVFMQLLSQNFPEGVVVLLPLLLRLTQICAEILCAGVFSLIRWRCARTS